MAKSLEQYVEDIVLCMCDGCRHGIVLGSNGMPMDMALKTDRDAVRFDKVIADSWDRVVGIYDLRSDAHQIVDDCRFVSDRIIPSIHASLR